jgi:hypothetical protein
MERILKEIAAKRLLQIALGYYAEHDDLHQQGEIVQMGVAYACRASEDFIPSDVAWPWDEPMAEQKDARNDLLVAGALIVAEIERLDRKAAQS